MSYHGELKLIDGSDFFILVYPNSECSGNSRFQTFSTKIKNNSLHKTKKIDYQSDKTQNTTKSNELRFFVDYQKDIDQEKYRNEVVIKFPGISLLHLLNYFKAKKKKIDNNLKQKWIYSIAKALSILHQHNYYFLNLSHFNVFIDHQFQLKLCYHLAYTEKDLFNQNHTFSDPHVIFYPPEYFQHPSNKSLTDKEKERYDVYSFGLLANEILSEKILNIEKLSKVEIQQLIESETFPQIIKSPLKQTLKKCVCKTSSERPTMLDIVKDLEIAFLEFINIDEYQHFIHFHGNDQGNDDKNETVNENNQNKTKCDKEVSVNDNLIDNKSENKERNKEEYFSLRNIYLFYQKHFDIYSFYKYQSQDIFHCYDEKYRYFHHFIRYHSFQRNQNHNHFFIYFIAVLLNLSNTTYSQSLQNCEFSIGHCNSSIIQHLQFDRETFIISQFIESNQGCQTSNLKIAESQKQNFLKYQKYILFPNYIYDDFDEDDIKYSKEKSHLYFPLAFPLSIFFDSNGKFLCELAINVLTKWFICLCRSILFLFQLGYYYQKLSFNNIFINHHFELRLIFHEMFLQNNLNSNKTEYFQTSIQQIIQLFKILVPSETNHRKAFEGKLCQINDSFSTLDVFDYDQFLKFVNNENLLPNKNIYHVSLYEIYQLSLAKKMNEIFHFSLIIAALSKIYKKEISSKRKQIEEFGGKLNLTSQEMLITLLILPYFCQTERQQTSINTNTEKNTNNYSNINTKINIDTNTNTYININKTNPELINDLKYFARLYIESRKSEFLPFDVFLKLISNKSFITCENSYKIAHPSPTNFLFNNFAKHELLITDGKSERQKLFTQKKVFTFNRIDKRLLTTMINKILFDLCSTDNPNTIYHIKLNNQKDSPFGDRARNKKVIDEIRKFPELDFEIAQDGEIKVFLNKSD
ncbi:hypothetical protein TRFO_11856 [Tritrichomonas foetus]|uniref:Protein kinase domain-containing protein n=1 Tax=Tritrichomonas foetus TaxID=1144522 RepID=A0A1J4J228_9EUKA|nr:hypothetical protein TRFO_11856 [Tritrichomonas foetus]|eukprot:OHS93426.1 hypothetical protein TRFO_11856 [Tritrichomonas foetus]